MEGFLFNIVVPCAAHGAHLVQFEAWVPEGEDSCERALLMTKLTFAVRMAVGVAAG